MISIILGVNKYVIDEYHDEFIEILHEHLVHQIHEVGWCMSHPDLRDKAGCIPYVRQGRTTHIITECIEINVINIIYFVRLSLCNNYIYDIYDIYLYGRSR